MCLSGEMRSTTLIWILGVESSNDCAPLSEGNITFGTMSTGKFRIGTGKARQDETEFVKKMKLYDIRPVSECYAKLSLAPMRTRWVDTDTGGGN